MTYLATLLATLAVELAIAAWLLRRTQLNGLLPVVLCANLVTHPIASFVLQGPWNGLGFWPVEFLVLLAEFALYRVVGGLSVGRSALLALATNGATVALSFLLP